MDAQSIIGVLLPTTLCLFYKKHIKLFLIEPLIHQVMEKMYWMDLIMFRNDA